MKCYGGGSGRKWFPLLAVFALMCMAVSFSVRVFGANDVSSEIAEAEGKVREAYAAVLDVESLGVNASGLVHTMNRAVHALGDANSAFRAGDYENASLLADLCVGFADDVSAEAGNLKKDAESRPSGLFMTAALSSVGVSVLFVLALFGWRFVKNRYVKHVLKMKPEGVVSG